MLPDSKSPLIRKLDESAAHYDALQAQLNDRNETLERYKERLTNFSGEFELGLFLYIARRSLVWVVFFFLIALAVAWLYLRYTQPMFESSAVMQVNNDNTAKMLNVQNLYELEDPNELASAIETAVQAAGVLPWLSAMGVTPCRCRGSGCCHPSGWATAF